MKREQIAEMYLKYKQLIFKLKNIGEDLSNRDIIHSECSTKDSILELYQQLPHHLRIKLSSLDSLFSKLELHASRDPDNSKGKIYRYHNLAPIEKEKDQKGQSLSSDFEEYTMEEDSDSNACLESKVRRKFKNKFKLNREELKEFLKHKKKKEDRRRIVRCYNCNKVGHI